MASILLYPIISTINEWSLYPEINHYKFVDETENKDDSYIYTTSSNKKDVFGFPECASQIPVGHHICTVQLNIVASGIGSAGFTLKYISSTSASYCVAVVLPTCAVTTYTYTIDKSSLAGGSYPQVAITSTLTSSTNEVAIKRMWLTVTYNENPHILYRTPCVDGSYTNWYFSGDYSWQSLNCSFATAYVWTTASLGNYKCTSVYFGIDNYTQVPSTASLISVSLLCDAKQLVGVDTVYFFVCDNNGSGTIVSSDFGVIPTSYTNFCRTAASYSNYTVVNTQNFLQGGIKSDGGWNWVTYAKNLSMKIEW